MNRSLDKPTLQPGAVQPRQKKPFLHPVGYAEATSQAAGILDVRIGIRDATCIISDFSAFDADTDAGYDLKGRSESLRRVGNRNGGTWDYFCFRGGGSGGSS